VTKVHRDSAGDGSGLVKIDLRAEGGKTRTVVLGPSWYVMDQAAAPARGDRVDLRVTASEIDAVSGHVAFGGTIDGESVEYRSAKGDPGWHADSSSSMAGKRTGVMRVSDLLGAPLRVEDTESAEVQDAVVETRSGRVVVVAIDPNENFLGLADTLYAVPWDVVRLAGEHARLDASEGMLKRAERLQEDVGTYRERSVWERLFEPFDTDAPDLVRSVGDRSGHGSDYGDRERDRDRDRKGDR